jgi:hypothetical protein
MAIFTRMMEIEQDMMSLSFQSESDDHELECRCNVSCIETLSDSVGIHAPIHADSKETSKGVLPKHAFTMLTSPSRTPNYAIPRYFKYPYN